jgi:Ras family protein T1
LWCDGSPLEDPIYGNAVETNAAGGITFDGFLSLWAFMTLLEPQKSLSYLVYLAYPEDPSSAFRITKQRRQDQKRQHSQRAAFQCFVFGPTGTGKSALLNALIGRYANFQ